MEPTGNPDVGLMGEGACKPGGGIGDAGMAGELPPGCTTLPLCKIAPNEFRPGAILPCDRDMESRPSMHKLFE